VNPLVQQLLTNLSRYGLNHWGVVAAGAYDNGAKSGLSIAEIAPGTKSILVVGNAGRAFWEAFMGDLRQSPDHLRDYDHPVDAYVSRAIQRSSAPITQLNHRWIEAAHDAPIHLDFRTLAVAAGLGAPSRLGLVIHPKYGPWMALRAACFLPLSLPNSKRVEDLCSDCAAPCVAACPGNAFSDRQWDAERCVTFHQESTDCSQSCASRAACPVGSNMAYSGLQQRYHYNRKTGRKEVAQLLDIEGDCRAGVGPLWGV